MHWDAFVEAHFRPHLVVLHQQSAAGHGNGLVERLLATSLFGGNHAQRSKGREIHVAFELADDAQRFARLVGGGPSVRQPEWPSRSTAWLTRSIRERILRHLRQETANARVGKQALSTADLQDRD